MRVQGNKESNSVKDGRVLCHFEFFSAQLDVLIMNKFNAVKE